MENNHNQQKDHHLFVDSQRLTMVFEIKRNDTFGSRFRSHGFMFRPQKPGGARLVEVSKSHATQGCDLSAPVFSLRKLC